MLVDKTITVAWWERLLADEERMVAWLQKLQVTEADGYYGNLDAITLYEVQVGTLAYRVFSQTAIDEQKHSDLLMDLLYRRGVPILDDQRPTSLYWDIVEKVVHDQYTFAAMTHLGERLAADRFAIIQQHPGTPKDVKAFIDVALPDESYHAKAYKSVSTPEAIAVVEKQHLIALEALLRSK